MDTSRLTICYIKLRLSNVAFKNSTLFCYSDFTVLIQCIMHSSTLLSPRYIGSSLDVNIELPVSNPESLDVCWVVWWCLWSNRTVFFRLGPLTVPILRQIAKWQWQCHLTSNRPDSRAPTAIERNKENTSTFMVKWGQKSVTTHACSLGNAIKKKPKFSI